MESIWKYNGGPSAWHFAVAFYFAFAFVAARFLLDRFVFRVMSLTSNFSKTKGISRSALMLFSLGEVSNVAALLDPLYQETKRLSIWLLSRGTNQLKLNDATRAKIVKCTESMWKFSYYATLEFCILATNYHEPWFRNVTESFRGWPNQELKIPLKFIYMCQCGFYIYSIAALLMWETRRKDFSVMMSHHVVTVILISGSYISSFFQIGAVILALHDASDVFLEAAKVFKYSGSELGASVFFGLFAVSWLVLRLIFFPFWVIRSSSYYLCEVLNLSEASHMGIYYVFNTMLLILLVFHVYWWKLICAMIIRQLKSRGKVGEDIRSDSEDDD